MKTLRILSALLLASPAAAQANAESELAMKGDVLGAGTTAFVSGATPQATVYVLPSLDLNGSNYLVSLSGDPNDFLTIGIGLAQQGRYATRMADAAGNATIPFVIPPLSTLLDREVYFQAFSATSPTSFERFSNTATISLNQAGRWQDVEPSPIPAANLAYVVDERASDGSAKSVFICGGGPYVLTDDLTPYPTVNQAWRYDTVKERFTVIADTMQDDRAFHNAVQLQDGRILVCGGTQGPYGTGPYHIKVLDTVEIFDPATETWSNAAPLSIPRAGSTATLLPDGRVLVAGGTKGDGQNRLFAVDDLLTTSLRTTEIYDPANNTWTAGPNMSEPKAGAVAVALDSGEVMIAGGITFQTIFGIPIPDFSDAVAFYDPASNSFRTRTMREKRALFGMTKLADGRVLMAGGAGGDIFSIGPIKKTEIYDPATDNFTNLALLSTSVAFSGCVTLPDGRAAIVGGATGDLDDPIPVNNCWIFDPNGDTITEVASMGATHAGHVTVAAFNGNITAIAGESDSGQAEATAESLTPLP